MKAFHFWTEAIKEGQFQRSEEKELEEKNSTFARRNKKRKIEICALISQERQWLFFLDRKQGRNKSRTANKSLIQICCFYLL